MHYKQAISRGICKRICRTFLQGAKFILGTARVAFAVTSLHHLGRATPLAHSWRGEAAQPAAWGAAGYQPLPSWLGLSKTSGFASSPARSRAAGARGRSTTCKTAPRTAAKKARSPKPHQMPKREPPIWHVQQCQELPSANFRFPHSC